MKYKEWLDIWFANYIEPSSKTKTCERYSEIIEKHLKVKLGEYELEELSPIVIQKYITELMQSGILTTGKGLAANSVNGIITVIQNSLKLAYTLGELKEYTADKIRRPKTKEKEVSCFSLAEQKKIEQSALSSKKRKFIGIAIGLYSGLRIGELLAPPMNRILHYNEFSLRTAISLSPFTISLQILAVRLSSPLASVSPLSLP